jgi:hypothetical protein
MSFFWVECSEEGFDGYEFSGFFDLSLHAASAFDELLEFVVFAF